MPYFTVPAGVILLAPDAEDALRQAIDLSNETVGDGPFVSVTTDIELVEQMPDDLED